MTQTRTIKSSVGRAQVTENLLREMAQRIVDAFHPQKIILFGSYAYGTPREDSDVDLFIIMESDLRPGQRSAQVSLACYPRPFPMDIIVRTPAEVEQRLAIGDHFVAEILNRGQVLYERSG